jgi:hypothetical protein
LSLLPTSRTGEFLLLVALGGALAALGVLPGDGLQRLQSGATAIAGMWLGRELFGVWLGWGVREMYAGPPWPGDPEERLLPVLGYRLAVAAGWTVLIVPALLFWCLVGLRSNLFPVPAVPLEVALHALVTEHVWWLSLVVFSLSTTPQLDHIWEDLDRAADEAWQARKPLPRRERTLGNGVDPDPHGT